MCVEGIQHTRICIAKSERQHLTTATAGSLREIGDERGGYCTGRDAGCLPSNKLSFLSFFDAANVLGSDLVSTVSNGGHLPATNQPVDVDERSEAEL
jgi:hypothetical protein